MISIIAVIKLYQDRGFTGMQFFDKDDLLSSEDFKGWVRSVYPVHLERCVAICFYLVVLLWVFTKYIS